MDRMDIDDHLSTPSTSTQRRILSSDGGPLTKKHKPDFSSNLTYASSGLKTSLHGTLYQLKLLLLCAIQAVSKKLCFELGTEMDAAEKFDDVVIKYKHSFTDKTWIWKFIQAKHKLSPYKSTIKISDLISESEGDFSLQKYFLSFCKIKANPIFNDAQLDEFILCTNTDFETNVKDQNYFTPDTDIEDDKFFYFNDDLEFNKFKFSVDAQTELSELFTQTILNKVLHSNDLKQKSNIMNFLKLKQTVLNNEIKEKIDYANNRLDFNINNNIVPMRDAMDTILKLKTKVLRIDTYKNLNKLREKFEPNNIKKTDSNYMQIFEEAKQELEKIINLLKEELKQKRLQLDKYLNSNTQFYIDLHKEADELLKPNVIINSYLEKLKETSAIQEIYNSIKQTEIVQYISEKTEKSLKEPNANVEVIKILIKEDLGKETSKLVALDLLIDENKLKEYLDDFINKFRFITNFLDEDELNLHLSYKLGQDFKLLNTDLLSDSFQKEMLQWFKQYHNGRSTFLTAENTENYLLEIMKKLHNLLASGLGKAYPDKLRNYGISFNNSFHFDEHTQSLHIVTNSTRLMSIQILQTLDNSHLQGYAAHDGFIFLRMRTLLRRQTQKLLFETYKSSKCHHLLIIEYQAKTNVNEQTLQLIFSRIDSILKTNKQKRLILISENNKDVLVNNNIKDFPNYRKEEYNIDFNTLCKETQESLLKQNCNFQGREIELNKIIDIKTAQNLFNKDNINVIIEKCNIKIGDTKAFDFNYYIQEYYIPRNLQRQKINSKILTNMKEQVFFVTGINQSKVLELGVEKNSIQYYSHDQEYSNGIILCTEIDHQNNIFQKLSEAGNTSIHWLDYKGENLYWMNSNRQFSEISMYLEIDNKYYFHEDDWNETHNIKEKVVIIANDAGVGKSTFLTSLAKNIRKKYDCTWIIRINLNDFDFDKDKNITITEDSVEYFADMALGCTENNNQIQHKLLKLSLSNQYKGSLVPKVVILFDGFDEICPNYRNQTITLIKAIYQTNISKIYVTTRVHEKSLLENNFRTPALMLKAFNEKEQISFLIKYWQYSFKFYKIQDNQVLRTKILEYLQKMNSVLANTKSLSIDLNIVVEIIQTINDELSTDNNILRSYVNNLNFSQFAENLLFKWRNKIKDNETSFNIVPLHLRMLAEIIFNKNFEIEDNFHILDLYDKFVEIKFEIYYDDKINLRNNAGSKELRYSNTNSLRSLLHKVSLQVLFPECYSEEINDETKVQLARTGILILKDTHLNFIHRSFAGYFSSEYFINQLNSTNIQIFMIQTVLREMEYRFIREFFNCQLERNKLNNIVISEDTFKEVSIEDESDNFLHTLAFERCTTTLIFFIDKIMKYPEILQRLMLAGKYANVLYTFIHTSQSYEENGIMSKSYSDTLYIILNKFKEFPSFFKNILTDSCGKYNLIGSIINDGQTDLFKIVLNTVKENQTFLRIVLMDPFVGFFSSKLIFKSAKLFSSFLNIIFETVQHDLLILEETLSYLLNFNKNSSLHYSIPHWETENFTNILKWITMINDNHNDKLLVAKYVVNLTALEIEIDKDECYNVVLFLNYLKTSFTETIFKDITSTNPKQNILFKSIVEGRTQTATVLLNWFYENFDRSTMKEMLLIKTPINRYTCLHWVCQRGFYKTLLVVLNFLKNVDSDPGLYNTLNSLLTSKCINGDTALIKAIITRKDNTTESLLTFLSCEVDTKYLNNCIHICNRNDENIIMVMAQYGTGESMYFLLDLIFNKLGSDILNNMIISSNKNGDTALHLILNKSFYHSICEVLLNFIHNNLSFESLKTILLKPNNCGKSPIHCDYAEDCDILHEKLDLIITNILDSNNLSELTMKLNTNEIETLQYYLKKYSKRYDKKCINTILENMKSHIPVINLSND